MGGRGGSGKEARVSRRRSQGRKKVRFLFEEFGGDGEEADDERRWIGTGNELGRERRVGRLCGGRRRGDGEREELHRRKRKAHDQVEHVKEGI